MTTTEKQKHTNETWMIGANDDTGSFYIQAGSHIVTDCIEREPDARLIAAAPDLLAALRAIGDMRVDHDTRHEHLSALCIAIARAAIARAEGGGA